MNKTRKAHSAMVTAALVEQRQQAEVAESIFNNAKRTVIEGEAPEQVSTELNRCRWKMEGVEAVALRSNPDPVYVTEWSDLLEDLINDLEPWLTGQAEKPDLD